MPERPVATIAIIAACVVVYVLQRLVPGFTSAWVFTPAIGSIEPWRFLTAAFLHSPSSLLHIVFNMVALWMVGPFLEQSLGRMRYVTLYLVSALAGSVGVVVAAYLAGTPAAWNTQVLGASGAVFGLFGAVLVVLRRTGRSAGGIVGVIVLNVVIGFVVPGIAWQAHLGGLAAGALLGAAYAYAPRSARRIVGVAASLGLVAVLAVATAVIYRAVGLL
ncbi:MAG: rhomboid family intramembrane serine protease [Cellulomonas sp.]|nr:rhomboid family intramembrane serine protease [Cellulomonas sp.]